MARPYQSSGTSLGVRRIASAYQTARCRLTPHVLGNIGEIKVVLVMLGITQRCRLCIYSSFLLAGICRAKDSQSFGISGHDSVLDSVVYHLDEVTCAVWTAVQISLFCRAGELF